MSSTELIAAAIAFAAMLSIVWLAARGLARLLGPKRRLFGLASRFAAAGLLLHLFGIVTYAAVPALARMSGCDIGLFVNRGCNGTSDAMGEALMLLRSVGFLYGAALLLPALVLFLGLEVRARRRGG